MFFPTWSSYWYSSPSSWWSTRKECVTTREENQARRASSYFHLPVVGDGYNSSSTRMSSGPRHASTTSKSNSLDKTWRRSLNWRWGSLMSTAETNLVGFHVGDNANQPMARIPENDRRLKATISLQRSKKTSTPYRYHTISVQRKNYKIFISHCISKHRVLRNNRRCVWKCVFFYAEWKIVELFEDHIHNLINKFIWEY
jgi:hypothetical protein